MKFTLSWLKQHLETAADADTIATALTAIGLEVEAYSDKGAALKDFIVAEIRSAEKHPQADKLQICQVYDGKTVRQVVCGAPNARAGIKVVLASEGVLIPANGMKIKKSNIRGIESNGMLCSADELGLGQESAGILELPGDAIPGQAVAPLLGLDDTLFDIAITPNRGDALGVRGIARDLAAYGIGTLKPLELPRVTRQGASPIQVQITNSVACPLFLGGAVSGVKNGESPDWLKARLTAIGLKPISALVDITNFLTFDLGRPLHVYDLAKLNGPIVVRSARGGETLDALNDKTYALEEGMTVISDKNGVLGLGGIIGGKASGVSETTTDVFIEAALFDPVNIAETGRKLQIDSDARYRFERGVDTSLVQTGLEYATSLILELCGGSASEITRAGEQPGETRRIHFSPALVQKLGGVQLSREESLSILKRLGFRIESSSDDACDVEVPSWRSDIEGAADLVEEILRIHGFAHIPATPLPKRSGVSKPVLSLLQKRVQKLRRLLAGRGLDETVSYTFISQKSAELFGSRRESMQLLNPISAELSTMRPSLLPNLLAAVSRNAARGFKEIALFEIGRQFDDIAPADQQTVVAGIRAGGSEARSHYKTERIVDALDAKTDIIAALSSLGIDAAKLQFSAQAPAWYHPGRSGTVSLGGKVALGYFGEIHPTALKQLDIKLPAVGFELFLEKLPEARSKGTTRAILIRSDLQAVERDFAFVVDRAVAVSDLVKAVEKAAKPPVAAVSVFDIYEGEHIPEGKKSVALCVRLEPSENTFTDTEIEAVSQTIIGAAALLGATLR